MGGVLSKHSKVNLICSFQGKDCSDYQDEDENDDIDEEPNVWFSDFYHYDSILTVENDSN